MRLLPSALMGIVVAAACLTAGAGGADAADREGPSYTRQLARPLVIGHRGAAEERPEHTLASYAVAMEAGADYIEPDLVVTKDGRLVARHENELSATTDVAEHPEFRRLRTTKRIEGRRVTGWFTEDFTLAQLRTLRAREAMPRLRPESARYDGRYAVPTLSEVLALVKRWEARMGHRIGVIPELKHPGYFASIGLPLERRLVKVLGEYGRDQRASGVVVQSFDAGRLRRLHRMTPVPLAQLTAPTPAFRRMLTSDGLRHVRQYAEWLVPEKSQVMPRNRQGATTSPSALVWRAHRARLRVVVYTVRDENRYLPTNYRRGSNPSATGDVDGEIRSMLRAGVDGLFADDPAKAVAVRDAWAD